MNKRPYVVELSGTPEAGKTTVIKSLIKEYESQGLRVVYIRESAEIVPAHLPKGSFIANQWMRINSLPSIIDASYDEKNDIVFIDRGIWDSIFFEYVFYLEGKCTRKQFESFSSFMKDDLYLPNLLIALVASPEEVIKRRGGEGRIVKKDWIEFYNMHFNDFYQKIHTPKDLIDTTNLSKEELLKLLLDTINIHKK